MSVAGLSGLFEECKGLDVYEHRVDTPEYMEIVFFLADLAKWQKVFEARFGGVSKPLGKEPTGEQLRLSEKFGGIRKHQVLFMGKEGASTFLVMFWPWEDKEHVTLKMAMCL